jgi:hypothetical protein
MNPLPDILTIVFALAASGAGLMLLSFWIEWNGQ